MIDPAHYSGSLQRHAVEVPAPPQFTRLALMARDAWSQWRRCCADDRCGPRQREEARVYYRQLLESLRLLVVAEVEQAGALPVPVERVTDHQIRGSGA